LILYLLIYLFFCATLFTAPLAQAQIKPPYLAEPDIPINQGFAPPPPPVNKHQEQRRLSDKIYLDNIEVAAKQNENAVSSKSGTSVPSKDWQPIPMSAGEASDPETRHRRDTVREMTQHAWSNYVKYAWGENELKPLSKRGVSAGIFGSTQMGTISQVYVLRSNAFLTRRSLPLL
jgi:hypothetical protein